MSRSAAAALIDPNSRQSSPVASPAAGVETAIRLRHARPGDRPAPALPLELQREVAEALARGVFEARQDIPGKWSARRTAAFIFASCSAFWIAFAWLMIKLF